MSTTQSAVQHEEIRKRPRVVALDDHPLILEGISAGLAHENFEVDWLGIARTIPELHELLENAEADPDVALIDLHLADADDANVLSLIETLTERGIPCVVVTADQRPVPLRRAITAGAVGVALKSDAMCRLVEVLRAAIDGSVAIDSRLAYALSTDTSGYAPLSPREVEVLRFLALGFTRSEVARAFTPPISESTVSTHLERVFRAYQKIGRPVRGTLAAVRAAESDGHL